MFIKIENILNYKFYVNGNVLIKYESKDDLNKFNVLLSNSETNFKKINDLIKFIPTSDVKLYYPKDILLSNTLVKKIGNSSDRNSYYKKVKEDVGNKFTKIEDITDDELKEVKRPILLDYTVHISNLNSDVLKSKKTGIPLLQYVGRYTNTVLSDISSKKGNLIIDITSSNDNLFKYLSLNLKKDFVNTSKVFGNLSIIVINSTTGIFFKLDLSDKKNVSKYLNMLFKFGKLSDNFNVVDIKNDPDFIEPKEGLDEEDKIELQSEVDKSSSKVDVKELEANKVEVVKDNNITNLNELPEEKSVDVISDVDFSEILDSNVEDEFTRVKNENDDFIRRTKHIQDKALGKLEEEANKLAKDKTLDKFVVRDSSIMNENAKTIGVTGITNSYYKKQFKKDMIDIIKSLNNDPETPVIVTKYEVTNNSTPLNLQEEHLIEFLDKRGKKHTFKVDLPILSHDGYLYINGNKKFIAKQLMRMPVVKETEDRVQITTNYRKTFLYRKGEKSNSKVDRILKLFTTKDFKNVKCVLGNSYAFNKQTKVSIGYNYLSSKFYSIDLPLSTDSKDYVQFIFNNVHLTQKLDDGGVKYDKDLYTPIGIRYLSGKTDYYVFENSSDKGIYSFKNNKYTKLSPNLPAYLESFINNNTTLYDAYSELKASKSLSYTEIKIVGNSFALGPVLGFYKGFIGMLDSYGIKYRMEDLRKRPNDGEILFAFKDINIYVDCENDTAKELVVNSLTYLDTKEYSIKESERFGAVFIDYFGKATGSRNNAKALINFEAGMIDPITKEILEELKLPTNFPDLLYYGNSLLGSFSHNSPNDMADHRVRDSETITVAFYNTLMTSFAQYKRTAKSGVVTPISMPRDSVIKTLSSISNVEGYSTLNPYLEMQTKSKVVYKGFSGLTFGSL